MSEQPVEAKISIRDASMILGVSPQAMRMFEKYNSAKRYGAAENGYRDFNFESMAELFTFRTLSQLGLSLAQSGKAVASTSVEGYDELLSSCEDSLRSQALRQ